MSKNRLTGQNQSPGDRPVQPAKGNQWLPVAAWAVALALAAFAIYIGWQAFRGNQASAGRSAAVDRASAADQAESISEKQSTAPAAKGDVSLPVALPTIPAVPAQPVISRQLNLQTIIPARLDEAVKSYTVIKGDSVFEIASQFNLQPESVLWANYDQLNDNPDTISLGMQLDIPPVDGVLYEWKAGDSIEGVAGQFEASPEDILSWPGNDIDLTSRTIEPGTLVMVPGGKREFRQWIIPTIPRGSAGVSQAVYGAGACEGSYSGAYGSGAFIWPAGNHIISGNDYWDGHLGIDIAAGDGAPIYAADSGVIVFAGWSTGGYGNMVMIDHGNGYQTVYGHLSSVKVGCGQSVGAGAIIGFGGSTGNSTGPHLHFEVRYQGGFVSPWYVLPAP